MNELHTTPFKEMLWIAGWIIVIGLGFWAARFNIRFYGNGTDKE